MSSLLIKYAFTLKLDYQHLKQGTTLHGPKRLYPSIREIIFTTYIFHMPEIMTYFVYAANIALKDV